MVNPLKKLKNIFLPSPDVSRERRRDVFGTESKAVAGAVIGAAAVALIAAPPAIAAAGGVRAAAASLGAKIGALPFLTKAGLVVGAPLALGAIANEPKIITRTAGGFANFESNLFEAAKDPSVEKFKDILVENPVISGIVASGTALAVGGGAAAIGATLINAASTRENTEALLSNTSPAAGGGALPSTPVNAPAALPVDEPLTRETQVVGKEVKSGSPARRKAKKKAAGGNISVRVINQQAYIQGAS